MAKTARIIGTGAYLPPKIVTNADLEKLVRNFDAERARSSFPEWADSVTGIRERRYANGESAEEMAFKASQIALETAGVHPRDVQVVIVGTFSAAEDIPNPANTVAHKLGITQAAAIPINTACAGFLFGTGVAYAMIRADMCRTALVVNAEVLSGVVDYDDPKTAVLFGDGAGAAVLRASEEGGFCGPPYLSSEYSEYIILPNQHKVRPEEMIARDGRTYAPKQYLTMPGGPRVLKNAIDFMASALLKALERTPYRLADLAYIIPHQANGRITQGLAKRLALPAEKICNIIGHIGNTSGSTIPIALDRALRGKLEGYAPSRGDKIGLTAVGGGYTIGAAVLEI